MAGFDKAEVCLRKLLGISLAKFEMCDAETKLDKIGHHMSIHFIQPRAKVHIQRPNAVCDKGCTF